ADRLLGGVISLDARTGTREDKEAVEVEEVERGSPDPAAIPIASLFDMRQFRPICHAP
ncbi:hypothetical protein ALC56_01810, partial [Trachymyrmex septentrionalis]